MKPAASIIFFTTLAGSAQGVALTVAAASLTGAAPASAASAAGMLWFAAATLLVALISSFFHLGHPERAWRTVLMWRTSWMSREVIVLPAFIVVVAAWALLLTLGRGRSAGVTALACAAIVLAFALWYCTAMIYACIRFIPEWAHPLTIVNYSAIGIASGLVTACALSAAFGDADFAGALTPWAIAATVLACLLRVVSLRRNARLAPKSTLQSATGIRSPHVQQKSMGMTGGSFNTREFFHDASPRIYRAMKPTFLLLAFAVPVVLLGVGWAAEMPGIAMLAAFVQLVGVLAERWFFFAQANHPQNLYYQVVS